MCHRSSQSEHGDLTPTRVAPAQCVCSFQSNKFWSRNVLEGCLIHQEVSCCRSLTRKLIWGPRSDKTTDVRAAKKRRQSQGTRELPGFFTPAKLMHRICGALVVKRAHYGNLMPLVFSAHNFETFLGAVRVAMGLWGGRDTTLGASKAPLDQLLDLGRARKGWFEADAEIKRQQRTTEEDLKGWGININTRRLIRHKNLDEQLYWKVGYEKLSSLQDWVFWKDESIHLFPQIGRLSAS